MRQLVKFLLLLAIPGTFIVRTWRLRHSNLPRDPADQYILDRIETDDGFLIRAPAIAWFNSDGEAWERVFERFAAAAAGVRVIVRWEALSQVGIGRDGLAPLWHFGNVKPADLLRALRNDSARVTDRLTKIQHLLPTPVARFRHRTVEISTEADFNAETLWRSYPVGDLLDQLDAKIAAGDGRGVYSYPHPLGDDEWLLARIEFALHFHLGLMKREARIPLRLHDRTLDIRATLEEHLILHSAIKTITAAQLSRGGTK